MEMDWIKSRCVVVLLIFVGCVFAIADGRAEEPTRGRRVLYNFDGDSCMFTRAGGKGPVALTVDDVKQLIEEVAYEGSQVDTVLVCIGGHDIGARGAREVARFAASDVRQLEAIL
jgi:hypothetical protein